VEQLPIDAEIVSRSNDRASAAHEEDYASLERALARRGIDIERIVSAVTGFGVAIPSWGVGTGGTRFGRFPWPGQPRNIDDKLADCAVINQLGRATPTVSLHFPWDKVDDVAQLKTAGARLGLGFDAVNSNTFQDHPNDAKHPRSYQHGSLSHTDRAVREQAVAHNLDCIDIGRELGSKALTVWIADGSNLPGQSHLARAFERYVEAASAIYAGLPDDWRLFLEHKMYEPAFYATVIQDWGSSLLAAQALGPKAFCLVDLGHHAPNVNIEMIVTRLVQAGKLGGFHFNDSKYGDDDLDAGSIDPFRLFLVFNELVDAEHRNIPGFAPAHMLDQSHNVTDPIESLITSAIEVTRAFAQALIVDRDALSDLQERNDALMAAQTLKRAFTTDVSPILAEVRRRKGGALDPIAAYRESGYRQAKAKERPAVKGGSGGIV
jgi:L-rhamnose isomerase/sugar isomerase